MVSKFIQGLIPLISCLSLMLSAPVVEAASQTVTVEAGMLKENIKQPYIVKKGDTLWDIAEYFFKDPHAWLKIWENNLYITNPDLIYPGNQIWFSIKEKKKTGGLMVVRPEPTVIEKPVERSEKPVDTSMYITALGRQDFIDAEGVEGVGYIVDAENERLNFGAGDKLYVKLNAPAKEGDQFDVFRTTDEIVDPESGDVVGVLVEHHGRIMVGSHEQGVYRAKVTKSFAEIMRGDRLKPAKAIDPRIQPDYPAGSLQGKLLYIQDDSVEAGQHQVVGINLGLGDGMKAGTVLSVHRQGRVIEDRVSGDEVQLPEEKIGEILVLVPQKDGSLAIVTDSTTSFNLGDIIRNKAKH